jgi:hypothetical protein
VILQQEHGGVPGLVRHASYSVTPLIDPAAVAFIDRDQTRKLQSGATLPPLSKNGARALRKITPSGGKIKDSE